MIILGIDPGAKGALVILTKPPLVFSFCKHDWVEISDNLLPVKNDCIAFIEAVSAMPRDASKHAFTFGENTGIIKGILIFNRIRFIEVHSQKWQRHFGLGAKFESKTARKNAQKAKAQELFPNIKVTLDIADALLIAKYGYDNL